MQESRPYRTADPWPTWSRQRPRRCSSGFGCGPVNTANGVRKSKDVPSSTLGATGGASDAILRKACGQVIVLRMRAFIRIISETLSEHRSYFDIGAAA
jgi:hypothetical protein